MNEKKKTIELILFSLSFTTFFLPWFRRHCKYNLDGNVFEDKEIYCPQISGFRSFVKIENIMDFSINNITIFIFFLLIIINLFFIFKTQSTILTYIVKIALTMFYIFIFSTNVYRYYELNLFEVIMYGFYLNIIITFVYLFYNSRK